MEDVDERCVLAPAARVAWCETGQRQSHIKHRLEQLIEAECNAY
jgi:hypothetical protein